MVVDGFVGKPSTLSFVLILRVPQRCIIPGLTLGGFACRFDSALASTCKPVPPSIMHQLPTPDIGRVVLGSALTRLDTAGRIHRLWMTSDEFGRLRMNGRWFTTRLHASDLQRGRFGAAGWIMFPETCWCVCRAHQTGGDGGGGRSEDVLLAASLAATTDVTHSQLRLKAADNIGRFSPHVFHL